MITKNIFIIILSLFITACSVNQIEDKIVLEKEKILLEREPVSHELVSEINYILFLLKQNDLETLNSRFIHPSFGFLELNKDENLKINIQQKFQMDEISNDIESFEIKEEEIVFNCSPYDDRYYGWDKNGVFLVPSKTLYLSDLMRKENLVKEDRYSFQEIEKAVFMDKGSYEITIPYNIIFYLTKIDGKWYITLIDKVKTDCSE